MLRVVCRSRGVETEKQADFLRKHGNVTFQGYLFGKPEPAENWLARWRNND